LPDQLDDGVVAAACRGDADALSAIWRALAPAVAGFLAARGAEDPDGLTSEVFLGVLPRLKEITGGVAGLRTFVFSVAHARLVDDARRRARRPATVEFDPVRHDSAAPSAEREAISGLDTEGVQVLLARLAPDYREVLSLRIIADLGVEQTATVMKRSVGSIKQLQRRALLALRAELALVTQKAPHSITDLR
jgi:RNA polymerase sigma-70 factor (ECF subfamily)